MSSDIKLKIKDSKRTNCLTLSAYNLTSIPKPVFELSTLSRLDLSANKIAVIPSSIGNLSKLRQLWVNDNPLNSLPAELAQCKLLTTIEASRTLVSKLPKELVTLQKLIEINLEECPLTPTLAAKYAEGFNAVWMDLQLKLDRRHYREEVFKRLKETIYPGEDPYALMRTTIEVFDHFKDISSQELKLLLHNLRRVFPEKLGYVVASNVRAKFDLILEELNKRSEISALSLKLKSKYPTTDMQEIANLASSLHTNYRKKQIELIFSKKFLPEDFEEVNLEQVQGEIDNYYMGVSVQLQKSIVGLKSKFKNVYFNEDADLDMINQCAEALGNLFKSPANLTKFIMNADQFLPETIEDFDPSAVKEAFLSSLKLGTI